jgi:hypothetical protein
LSELVWSFGYYYGDRDNKVCLPSECRWNRKIQKRMTDTKLG